MILSDEQNIGLLRKAGKLAGEVLDATSKMVIPGITTWELDVFAEQLIRDGGGIPTF